MSKQVNASTAGRRNPPPRIGSPRALAAVGFAVISLAIAAESLAQAYPTRAVRFIVPYPPAGNTDVLARLMAARLGEAWGQQIIVDNRPGGGANIGAEIAARSAPDGQTLFMAGVAHSSNPSVYAKLGYDPVRDFAHVVFIATIPGLLVVHPSVPVRSVKELIDYSRARPGQLAYASTGNGGPQHFAMELFKTMTGVDMVHVPYKGAAPALTDIIAGQTQTMFGNMMSTIPHVRTGKLRGLAITTAKRSKAAAELPTVAESGLPGFESGSWNGIMVPAATPRRIVDEINRVSNRIIASAEFRERLAIDGGEAVGGTPEAFAAHVRAEVAKWSKVAKAAKLRID